MQRAIHLFVAAVALAGCAPLENTADGGGYVEKEYRTGSNIPVHSGSAPSGVSSATGDDVEKARNSSINAGPSVPLPRGGSR